MDNHQRKVELSDIAATIENRSSRKFIARILNVAGINQTTYVKGDIDEMVRRSARRDLAVWILREIKEAAPELYFTLLKEVESDEH